MFNHINHLNKIVITDLLINSLKISFYSYWRHCTKEYVYNYSMLQFYNNRVGTYIGDIGFKQTCYLPLRLHLLCVMSTFLLVAVTLYDCDSI